MIMSASFELIFVHKTPIKVIVSEYVKISDFFLENAHKRYLNAILDKVSKNVRNFKINFLPFIHFFGNYLFFKDQLGRIHFGQFNIYYFSWYSCCCLQLFFK